MSTGNQNVAESTSPRKINAHPMMAASSTSGYCLSAIESRPAMFSDICHTENAHSATPATISSMEITARTTPARRVSVSSMGRNASSGVTAVAERAEPSEAITVIMMPNAIGTVNTGPDSTSRMVMPVAFIRPDWHSAAMSPMPRPTPSAEAISPSTPASNSTETYSWLLFAPMVRSRASVRRRCATSTWKVLAMTSAATSMASMPKLSRKMVVMLVSPELMLLTDSSTSAARDCTLKCLGSSVLTCFTVDAAAVSLASSMSR